MYMHMYYVCVCVYAYIFFIPLLNAATSGCTVGVNEKVSSSHKGYYPTPSPGPNTPLTMWLGPSLLYYRPRS